MVRISRLPVAAALFIVLGVLVTSPSASARNQPIATEPAPGSHTTRQIDAVTVVLDKPIKAPYKMVVTKHNGGAVSMGDPSVVSTNMALQLDPDLPDGVYEVEFRSQGTEGPEGGSFQFVLGDRGSVDYPGIKTWGGFDKVPSSLALKGDDEAAALARQHGTATPSPTVSNPAASPGTESADSIQDSANKDQRASDSDYAWWPWALIAGVIAAGIAAFVIRRRVNEN